ncbi:hypothetical protein STRDD11_02045 [Streptococcus sp. DD11]|nr:hypothetical protein STRDD11_02045 [Streptococcus sp. DD11]
MSQPLSDLPMIFIEYYLSLLIITKRQRFHNLNFIKFSENFHQ